MEPMHRNAVKPGQWLHSYQIGRVLGQGGFGITYLAHDSNLDQEVAIKEYLPIDLAVRERGLAVQPAADAHRERFKWGLDRFMAEAQTLARFKHPNICVFEANSTGYMAYTIARDEHIAGRVGSAEADPHERLTRQRLMTMNFNTLWLGWAMARAIERHGFTPDHFVAWANRARLFGDDTALLSAGLQAWQDHDYAKAIHLLVPQVERGMRAMVRLVGKPVTKAHRAITSTSGVIDRVAIVHSLLVLGWWQPPATVAESNLCPVPNERRDDARRIGLR